MLDIDSLPLIESWPHEFEITFGQPDDRAVLLIDQIPSNSVPIYVGAAGRIDAL
jgi:hypothetical protein